MPLEPPTSSPSSLASWRVSANGDDLVADTPVEGLGPEVLTNPLDEVGPARAARVHGALGVGADHADRPVRHLLQVAPGARDGATGAHTGDELGDPAARLLPQLRPRRLVVGEWIVRVGVLVGLPASGRFRRKPVRHPIVGPRVLRGNRGWADDDLGAVGPEHVDLVGADLVRTDEDAPVPTLLRHQRQTDACVATGGLDDGPTSLENPGLLGCVDHPDGDAVLDTAAGVEVLDLGQNRGPDALCHPAQPDQWRVADQAHDRFVVAHSVSLAGC